MIYLPANFIDYIHSKSSITSMEYVSASEVMSSRQGRTWASFLKDVSFGNSYSVLQGGDRGYDSHYSPSDLGEIGSSDGEQ